MHKTVTSDGNGNPRVFDIPCSTLTRVGTTATFTSPHRHRLTLGQKVSITGVKATGAQPNVQFYNRSDATVASVAGISAFTYVMLGDPGTDTPDVSAAKARAKLTLEEYSDALLLDPQGRLIAGGPSGEVYGNLSGVTPTASPLASNLVLAEPARLLWASFLNNNAAADYWVMLFNQATSPPANGTIPAFRKRLWRDVAPYPGAEFDFGDCGFWFSVGVVWALSTTPGSLTLGAADGFATLRIAKG